MLHDEEIKFQKIRIEREEESEKIFRMRKIKKFETNKGMNAY